MRLAALLTLVVANGQVIVSMELVNSGTTGLLGKGLNAFAWNILACQLGPRPVPFIAVRLEFPEVRLFSIEQQTDLLAQRVTHSAPARILRYSGFAVGAAGTGLAAYKTYKHSPSQIGPIVTAVGLAIPASMAMLGHPVPSYTISNPAPAVIALPVGACAEYTNLAARGVAPNVIPPRRINPIGETP